MNVSSYLASHKKAEQLIDPVWAILHAEDELLDEQMSRLNQQVKRLELGEPLAYVLGHRNFYGRDFLVTPDVLIPRPETEIIIDIVKKIKPASVLDVGTGSGCIAITVKAELLDVRVDAVDISSAALKIATKNAKRLLGGQKSAGEIAEKTGANAKKQNYGIDFKKSDLLDNVDGEYDLIVANLPYVDRKWDWLDQKSLGYEPSLALYADEGGLALVKKLVRQIAAKQSCKYLILEADPCQHARITDYAGQHLFGLIREEGYILVFESTKL